MLRLALALLATSSLFAADLRVGAAQVVITPPPGAPMAGYYYNRSAAGVHDDLHAKALVIERAGIKLAIVACDLSGMPRPIVDAARPLIAAATGIPPAHVMISATHTHTGPVLLVESSRYNVEGEMRQIGEAYARSLPAKIAEAVKLANDRLQPARLFAGIGREDSLTFNRRFHMKDGTVAWNPGKLNPNIVRPAGPIDPAVPVIYAETPDGKPIAAYVNYALHLDTVGGDEYSADYPYTLSKLLAQARGDGLVTLFTIGCAGNLNHIDVSTRAPQKGHGEAARIGTVLAGEVLRTSKNLKPISDGPIRASTRTVQLPLALVKDDEVAPARAVAATFGKPGAAPFNELVKAARIVDVAERNGKPIDAEVQVFSIGNDLAFVAFPGEIFTELGLAVKNASPFPFTVVAELANGSPGYIPDLKAHAQGAYEAISARCAPGSGEMLVDAATRLLLEHRYSARP